MPKAIAIGSNASLIPISLAQKIHNNEFVKLADFLGDNLTEENHSAGKEKDGKHKIKNEK